MRTPVNSRAFINKRPKYVPSVGHHSFWWNGQYFRLQRKKESLFDDRHGFGTFKDKEDLMISCIWRNPGNLML